ncbi:MAG: hypothetical protein M0026_01185 [Nocardiopsaceae bacterium]|nr:hypothetical protein [Nocardiopsaceae bacterium]
MNRSQANGWAAFGATLLFIVGAMNIVQGLVAMFRPEHYLLAGGQTLLLSMGLWGLLLAIWGLALWAAGLALLSGQTWARVVAVALAAINAVAQLGFFASLPLWSAIVIAIDVLVIYAMTAGWPDTSRRTGAYAAGQADARGATARDEAAESGMARERPGRHEQSMG